MLAGVSSSYANLAGAVKNHIDFAGMVNGCYNYNNVLLEAGVVVTRKMLNKPSYFSKAQIMLALGYQINETVSVSLIGMGSVNLSNPSFGAKIEYAITDKIKAKIIGAYDVSEEGVYFVIGVGYKVHSNVQISVLIGGHSACADEVKLKDLQAAHTSLETERDKFPKTSCKSEAESKKMTDLDEKIKKTSEVIDILKAEIAKRKALATSAA